MTQYLIASLAHTHRHHEHITFWGPDWRGYVLAITDERVGKYDEAEAQGRLNDGELCIAAPEDAVKALLVSTPFYANSQGVARQFYDIAGPVVNNTRDNWNKLIAASLPRASGIKPKPEVFRGQRRSFQLPTEQYAAPAQQVERQELSDTAPTHPPCPITGRKWWGDIDHPEMGVVPTYGGPFDTYTAPYADEDGELRCERFDQDAGHWIEGGEPLGVYLTTEQPNDEDLPSFINKDRGQA